VSRVRRSSFARGALTAVLLSGVVASSCNSGPSTPPTPTAEPTPTVISTEALAEICVRAPLPAEFRPGEVPPWDPGDQFAILVEKRLALYHEQKLDYRAGLKDYDPAGDYLDYGKILRYEEDTTFRWDERGIPLVQHDGEYHTQPTTTANYALALYGRMLAGTATKEQFLAAADALIGLQDSRGAFPYSFRYEYYRTKELLEPGWVSALAQGLALSVFRRAYDLSGDERYIEAGNAALEFMAESPRNGGTRDTLARLDPSLDRFVFFKEYPTADPQYTLNGFLFDLVGLYDWSGVNDSDDARLARDLFDCGIASTIYLLPYHEIGGISAYDLGHIIEGGAPNVPPRYHAIHIRLLNALNSVAPHPELAFWRDKWMSQVDEYIPAEPTEVGQATPSPSPEPTGTAP